MSRCKRCGIVIDFDDELEIEAFEEYGECTTCCESDVKTLEEIDEDVRAKWMENRDSGEGLPGLW